MWELGVVNHGMEHRNMGAVVESQQTLNSRAAMAWWTSRLWRCITHIHRLLSCPPLAISPPPWTPTHGRAHIPGNRRGPCWNRSSWGVSISDSQTINNPHVSDVLFVSFPPKLNRFLKWIMWIWSWTRISNPIICQESYFNKRNDPCPPTLHQCGKKSQVNKHNNCRHRVIKVLVSCVLLPKWTDSWGECIMQVMSIWSWTRISNPRTCPLSYLTRGLTHVYPHCINMRRRGITVVGTS